MAGNRLRKETEKEQEFYAYNKKNQLLRLEKGAEVAEYHYDIQGNLLEETGTSGRRYVYDALNRLNSVTIGTAAQKNHYDGESLRYETEENGKVIRFAFDCGELSAEETAGGSIRYIHGTNDVVCSERDETGPDFHIRDEVGSTLFILDKEQNIRKTYRYDAFGGVLEERGDIENRLTYTGQMYDGVMGQYYLRARFYNPAIGRFLQEDVYRGDGLNLYAYCANNPVMYYDPSGYIGLCPKIKTNPGQGGIEGSRSTLIEVVDSDAGTFKIKDWSEYPDEYVPLPNKNKEWVLLEGDTYVSARKKANEANRNIRQGDSYYSDNRLEIHEIEPVKFGGSPTDSSNKVAIQGQAHRKYVTPWWNKIRDEIKKGLNK